MNTASRIEQHCKTVGRPLLISGTLLNSLEGIDDLVVDSVGAVELRGHADATELFAVSAAGQNSPVRVAES